MSALAQKIVFGSVTNPILTLTERSVDAESISAVLSAAVVGDEIAVDEMTATADNAAFTIFADNLLDVTGKQLVSSDNYHLSVRINQNIEKILPNLPIGTALWYYADNSLVGKFYVKNVKRLDKLRWRIKAQSIVGVLDGLQYMGRMCSGETFGAIIADILGNTTPFTVSPELAGLAVFGHFPIMSRRAALHWLLFTKGANLFKDSNGDPYFDFLSAKAENISLPKNLVFYGDTIEQDVAASRAEITEHTYLKLASTERITLFDNTDGRGTATFETVTFGEPVYDLRTTDTLTITESGCNYAVISGVGVLTGVPYIHTNRIVSTGKSDSKLRTCSVTDVTIISLVESINVANRVLAYYRYGKKTHADFVRNTEKPTDILSYTNSWGEPEQGYIAGMELKTSSLQRATVDLISGYTPTGEGNNYNYSIILTGSGVWYPPTGTKRVRAVLISGGQGGQGGWYGENGTGGGSNGHGEGGNGGAGGQAGSGGRITLADFESDGSAISYATGAGGIGGAGGIRSGFTTTAPTLGDQGGDTTFGSYTTANGNLAPNGIANIFSGEVYALPGYIGLSGKKGGKTNEYAAEDYPPNTGGQQGKTNTLDSEGLVAYGGGGGGAAFGSNGENGYPGSFSQTTIEGEPQTVAVGGKGGKGATPNATPDAPVSTDFGRGGTGGYGGGGGGGGAAGSHIFFSGDGGAGGNGSDGGTGAPGCIILYY